MDLLLTGFRDTSAELLVKKAKYTSLLLPSSKVIDSQLLIEELRQQKYKYIFSFGQKPNIKDKLYLETTARNMPDRLNTNFAYIRLASAFSENNLSVKISNNAGTSFCNSLYWNGLSYIYNTAIDAKMIFLHIPFCKNITDSERFFHQILTAIEHFCSQEICDTHK
jgi:Pyrrolidone-carboxylate peptidase (N-terminal pyroglutamyl peptidase)